MVKGFWCGDSPYSGIKESEGVCVCEEFCLVPGYLSSGRARGQAMGSSNSSHILLWQRSEGKRTLVVCFWVSPVLWSRIYRVGNFYLARGQFWYQSWLWLDVFHYKPISKHGGLIDVAQVLYMELCQKGLVSCRLSVAIDSTFFFSWYNVWIVNLISCGMCQYNYEVLNMVSMVSPLGL